MTEHSSEPHPPIVSVAAGQVRGLSDGTVRRFLGIPYAAPPTGANRFREPQPVQPPAVKRATITSRSTSGRRRVRAACR